MYGHQPRCFLLISHVCRTTRNIGEGVGSPRPGSLRASGPIPPGGLRTSGLIPTAGAGEEDILQVVEEVDEDGATSGTVQLYVPLTLRLADLFHALAPPILLFGHSFFCDICSSTNAFELISMAGAMDLSRLLLGNEASHARSMRSARFVTKAADPRHVYDRILVCVRAIHGARVKEYPESLRVCARQHGGSFQRLCPAAESQPHQPGPVAH